MNEMLKLGLTLMTITLVAGIALALTNHFTNMEIEKQKQLALKESLGKVISAESFKEMEGYYEAYDANNNLIGRVIKVEATGYSSVISSLVGLDLDNKIIGIEVLSQQETAGLGANIAKESFLKQFIGKTKEELKIKKDGGQIDAITGATISSRAITDGVRKKIESLNLGTNSLELQNETG